MPINLLADVTGIRKVKFSTRLDVRVYPFYQHPRSSGFKLSFEIFHTLLKLGPVVTRRTFIITKYNI